MSDTNATNGRGLVSFRRLVTGKGPDGHSRLIDDRRVNEAPATNFDHWITLPSDRRSDQEALAPSIPFYAKPGQTLMRIVRIPPADPTMTSTQLEEVAANFFSEHGIPECRVDTRRHPMMHVTRTIDYVVLLSGELSLLLDEGDPIPLQPFDAVIQRGTNHAWINTGKDPAVFLVVMVGAA